MTIKVTYNVTDVYMSQSVSPVYINVSYSDGSSSGGGVWGTITGTLSNQTDLQNALNAKVPYSGATGDVSLGEYGINVGNVIYDTTPTGIPTEQGATYWDADAETVALIMNGTIQKIGEDTFYHVRNTTGSTIAKGTAVRFSGTTGNSGRLLIAPMLANGTYPSQYYMGITSEELVNNADGKVYHFGKMRNINTSAFADGDVLYVSPSVAGALTATAPVAPNNIIVAAAVVHAANNGTLMIRTTLGSNINADEGVLLTTPTANQGLFYDSGLWVNKSITTALGYTPVPTTRNITINGVTYDLSADRTWTIAAGISGSGASGQVTYWTGASAVSGSNNLFWDNANGRLGIGTNAPSNALDVNGTARISILGINGVDTIHNQRLYVNGNIKIEDGGGIGNTNVTTGEYLRFSSVLGLRLGTNGSERLRVFQSTGNLGIGGTFTDAGQRLQVYGDTLLRGSGATSSTTALTVQNSDGTQLLRLQNQFLSGANTGLQIGDGTNANTTFIDIVKGAATVRTRYIDVRTSADILYITGGFGVGNNNGTGYTGSIVVGEANYALTSATQFQSAMMITGSFVPTSGGANFADLTIRPIINQQGGANGITRGLYVNPTLTSAADFRAIETTAGNVLFGSNFFWDNTNGRLGIGTNAPAFKLDVSGGARVSGTNDLLTLSGSSTRTTFKMTGTAGGYTEVVGNGTDFYFTTNGNTNISFITNNVDRAKIYGSTGNLVLQNGGTFLDLGQRLQVIGDTLLRGSGATSATTALTVQNSSSTNLFTVRNDGLVTVSSNLNPSFIVTSNVVTRIGVNNTNASPNAGIVLQTNGVANWSLANYVPSGTTNASFVFYNDRTATDSLFINGDNNNVGIRTNAPTARLDVPASVTSAASLRIRSGTAPTTPNDGDIWFDGTDIKMRIGGVTKTFTLI